jgi:hypothetical protein
MPDFTVLWRKAGVIFLAAEFCILLFIAMVIEFVEDALSTPPSIRFPFT